MGAFTAESFRLAIIEELRQRELQMRVEFDCRTCRVRDCYECRYNALLVLQEHLDPVLSDHARSEPKPPLRIVGSTAATKH
jgi:hypothetical protein